MRIRFSFKMVVVGSGLVVGVILAGGGGSGLKRLILSLVPWHRGLTPRR